MPGMHREPAGAMGPSVDYASLIKKLRSPPGFTAPTRLTYENLFARAITRADLDDDVRGINTSIALIQRTRGGGWPTEPVTEDFNFVDLVWHELAGIDGGLRRPCLGARLACAHTASGMTPSREWRPGCALQMPAPTAQIALIEGEPDKDGGLSGRIPQRVGGLFWRMRKERCPVARPGLTAHLPPG
jgi:hypothetical protein